MIKNNLNDADKDTNDYKKMFDLINKSVNVLNWRIPINSGGHMEIFLKMYYNFHENLRLEFYDFLLKDSFHKIFLENLCYNWSEDIHGYIYDISLFLIELAAISIFKDRSNIFIPLCYVFDEDSVFHICNKKRQANEKSFIESKSTKLYIPVASEKFELSGAVRKFFWDQDDLNKFLIDFLELFDSLNGFNNCIKRLNQHIDGSNKMKFEVLINFSSPFFVCLSHLSEKIIEEFIRPLYKAISQIIRTMNDEITLNSSSIILKDLKDPESLQKIYQALNRCAKFISEEQIAAEAIANLVLQSFLNGIRVGSFKVRMKHLHNLNKILSSASEKYYECSSDLMNAFTPEILSTWISKHIDDLLTENMHNLQYVDRIKQVLLFLQKHGKFSEVQIDTLWTLRIDKHEAIVKNINELIIDLAKNLDQSQCDHVLSLIKKEWSFSNKKQKQKLISLMKRLVLETSSIQISDSLLNFLWDFSIARETCEEIARYALNAHLNILLSDNMSLSNYESKTKWIKEFLEIIKGKQYNSNKFKSSLYITHYAIDTFKGLILPQNTSSNNTDIFEWFKEEKIDLIGLLTDSLVKTISTAVVKEARSIINEFSSSASSTLSRDSIVNNLDDFVITQEECVEQIDTRLQFIKSLVISKNFEISLEIIQKIWRILMNPPVIASTNPLIQQSIHEREHFEKICSNLCLNWFQSDLYSKLELKTVIKFYQNSILTLPKETYSILEFNLFKYIFEFINIRKKNLTQINDDYSPLHLDPETKRLPYLVNTIELVGIDHLWLLSMECTNEYVSEHAVCLLMQLHTSLHHEIIDSQTEINRMYIEKCLRCIEISTNIIDSITDVQKPEQASNLQQQMNFMRRSLLVINSFIIQSEMSYNVHSYWKRENLPQHMTWRGSKIQLAIACSSVYEGNEGLIRKPFFDFVTSTNHSFVEIHRSLLQKCLDYLGLFSASSISDLDDKEKLMNSITLKVSIIDSDSKTHLLCAEEYYLPLAHFIEGHGIFNEKLCEFTLKIHLELVERKHPSQDHHHLYTRSGSPLDNNSKRHNSVHPRKDQVSEWIINKSRDGRCINPLSSHSSSSNIYQENSKSSSLNNEIEENPVLSDLDCDDDDDGVVSSDIMNREYSMSKDHPNQNPSISSVSVYGQERYLPGFQLAKSTEYISIVFKALHVSQNLPNDLFQASQFSTLAVLHQVEDLLMTLVQWVPPFRTERNTILSAIKDQEVIQFLNQVFQRSSSEFLYLIQILYGILKPKELLDNRCDVDDDQGPVITDDPIKFAFSLIDQGFMTWLLNKISATSENNPTRPAFLITRDQLIALWLVRLLEVLLDIFPGHPDYSHQEKCLSIPWDIIFKYTSFPVDRLERNQHTRKELYQTFVLNQPEPEKVTKPDSSPLQESAQTLQLISPTFMPYGFQLSFMMPERCIREFDFDNFMYCSVFEAITDETDSGCEKTSVSNQMKIIVLLSYDTAHQPRCPRSAALKLLPKIMHVSYRLIEKINHTKVASILIDLLKCTWMQPHSILRGDFEISFKACLRIAKTLSEENLFSNYWTLIILSACECINDILENGKNDRANQFTSCFINLVDTSKNEVLQPDVSLRLEQTLLSVMTCCTKIIYASEPQDYCQFANLLKITKNILETNLTLDPANLNGFVEVLIKKVLFPTSFKIYESSNNEEPQYQLLEERNNEPPEMIKKTSFDLLISIISRSDDCFRDVSKILSIMHFNAEIKQTVLDWLPDFDDVTCKYVGLKNAGATCYLNSILQQIFSIEPIQNVILKSKPNDLLRRLNQRIVCESDSENESVEDSAFVDENLELSEEKIYHLRVLAQIQMLFVNLKFSKLPFYNPLGFLADFRLWGERINRHEQHDALEFFSCLVDNIDEGMMLCHKLKPFESVFLGTTENQMICRDCPHRTQRDETFMTINADVHQLSTLKESLEQYVKADLLEGGNAYKCETCQKKVSAVKRAVIKHCPPVLAVQLLRFRFDYEQNIAIKSNSYFEFPRQLDLYPYTVQGTASFTLDDDKTNEYSSLEELRSTSTSTISNRAATPSFHDSIISSSTQIITNTKYTLRGIVVHNGQASGGHYYSFIRVSDPSSPTKFKWYRFDDREVRPIDLEKDQVLKSECFGGPMDEFSKYPETSYMKRDKNWNAYILFYERDDIFANGSYNLTDSKRLIEFFKTIKPNKNTPAPPPPPLNCKEICSSSDLTLESSSEVVLSVVRKNLKYAHKMSQLSPSFIEFSFNFVKLIADNLLKESEANIKEHYSSDLLSQILPFYSRIVMKVDYKNCNIWIEQIMRLLAYGAKPCTEMLRNFIMSSSTTLSDYLFDCPQIEVRSVYSVLLTILVRQTFASNTPLAMDVNSLLEAYTLDMENYQKDNKCLVNCRRIISSLRMEDDLAVHRDEPVYISHVLFNCLMHEINFSNSKTLNRLKNSINNYYNNVPSKMTNLFQYGIVNLFDKNDPDAPRDTANKNFTGILDELMETYQPGCFAQFLALICDIISIDRSINQILNEKHKIVVLLIELLNEDQDLLNISSEALRSASGRLSYCPIISSREIQDEITRENLTSLIVSRIEGKFKFSDNHNDLGLLCRLQKATMITLMTGIFGQTPLPNETGLNSSHKIYSPKIHTESDFSIIACNMSNCIKHNYFLLLSHCLCSMDTSRYYTTRVDTLNPYRTYSDDIIEPYDCEICEDLAQIIFDESNKIIAVIVKDFYDVQYFHHIKKIALFLSFEHSSMSNSALEACFASIYNPDYYPGSKMLRELLYEILTIDDSLKKKRFDYFLILIRNLNKSLLSVNNHEKQLTIYLDFLIRLFEQNHSFIVILSSKETYNLDFIKWLKNLQTNCSQRLSKIETALKQNNDQSHFVLHSQEAMFGSLHGLDLKIQQIIDLLHPQSVDPGKQSSDMILTED